MVASPLLASHSCLAGQGETIMSGPSYANDGNLGCFLDAGRDEGGM